jgi:hypothetical protein
MCVCVLCLIVVPLPPGKNTFAVQLNNNNKKVTYASRGGGLVYVHSSPASLIRKLKGKWVSAGITKPPCHWGTWAQ